jgi:hypothetical protein
LAIGLQDDPLASLPGLFLPTDVEVSLQGLNAHIWLYHPLRAQYDTPHAWVCGATAAPPQPNALPSPTPPTTLATTITPTAAPGGPRSPRQPTTSQWLTARLLQPTADDPPALCHDALTDSHEDQLAARALLAF